MPRPKSNPTPKFIGAPNNTVSGPDDNGFKQYFSVSSEKILFPSLSHPVLNIPNNFAKASAVPCPFADGISACLHSLELAVSWSSKNSNAT